MSISEIRTGDAPAPVGPYSQAVLAGDIIFCAGQIPLDPAIGEMVVTNIEAETSRVMDNLAAVLKAAGSSLDNVAKTTIFVTDMNDFSRINTVYGTYFNSGVKPARATVQVAALPKGAHVEIECIAIRQGE